MTPPHALLVDDSLVVRSVLGEMLRRAGGMRVSSAADPVAAMAWVRTDRPDVIVLDIEMARMNGLTFLRLLMTHDPLPVVVCSGRLVDEPALALDALRLGAVDVIAKPPMRPGPDREEAAVVFADAVRAAAGARLARGTTAAAPPAVIPPSANAAVRDTSWRHVPTVVAIGASTGGTDALRALLAHWTRSAPPTVIVQHMPAGFTAAFARDLARSSAAEVREARTGDRLTSGLVLLAPGGSHLSIVRHGPALAAVVAEGPLVSRHRPSVDVLFRAVARAAAATAVGVLLTGMGEDGGAGLLAMRDAGGFTIAQDADSSVVYGMPRVARDLGAAREVLALDEMGPRLRALWERAPERRAAGAGAGR